MKIRPFHLQRPLVCAAAAFALGVWAGVQFTFRPWLYMGSAMLCLTAALLLPREDRSRTAGFLGVMLFVGMLLGGYAYHPNLPEEGTYAVTATLAGDVTLREDGSACGYLTDVTLKTEAGEEKLSRVYWTYTPSEDGPILPSEGDRISFTGKLYHPKGRENPYGFDFRLFLLEKGAVAGVSGGKELAVTGHPGRGLASWCYQARKAIAERLDAVFGEDGDLPKALLIGQRSELPQETVRGFTDAGAAHILAVSGLHVALLAGVLSFPLRRLLKPGPRTAVLSVFLLLYCALLDFSAPVVRASLLMVIAGVRRTVRRAGDGVTALAAAFLLILLFRPLDLFSASFQLSFCAVLGVELMLPALERRLPRRVSRTLGVTWAATAGAAVPTAQIFHRISLVGLAVNPLVGAAFAVLLPMYLMVFAAGCVYLPAGTFLAGYLNIASRAVVAAVTAAGKLPFATVNVPYLPWYCVLALAIAAALATRFTVWPGRRKAVCAGLLLLMSFGCWRLILCRDVTYVQLSMGQADSAILTDGSETAVIDAGDYGGDVAAYLLSTGRRADRLILTHLHTDHCGGLRQLLDQRVEIGCVYLPEGAEDQQIDDAARALMEEVRAAGIEVRYLAAGDTLSTARTRMTVLWPESGKARPGQDANRFSLVTLWEMDGVRLLHCADLPGDYEMYAAADADIVKIAHHGSRYSTGAEFLSRVTPGLALISSGYTASVPHPDTLSRLRDAGCGVLCTGTAGAVTVTFRDGVARAETYLDPKEQE